MSDPDCDAPPVVVARYAGGGSNPDGSPTVLDPDDVWVAECTRTTAAPGADCAPFTLDNTATVVATQPNRPTVGDEDTATTPLTCPPLPPEPPVPPEPPEPPVPPEPAPEPVTPSGETPEVPEAGTAGAAALSPLRRCLRKGSRVAIRGSRIAQVRVVVNGRRVGGLQVRALQDRVVIRLRRELRAGPLPGHGRGPLPARRRDAALAAHARGARLRTAAGRAAVHRLRRGRR